MVYGLTRMYRAAERPWVYGYPFWLGTTAQNTNLVLAGTGVNE